MRRGPYGGCVGYVDYSGNMDMAIAIRTMLVQDGSIFLQSGGGVVADSDPEAEYQESHNKARALIQAIDLAREGSDCVRLLVIDNYDSFTYNLVQYLGELGAELDVVRNDAEPLEALVARRPDGVVISPGPGRPEDAGVTVPAVRAFGARGMPLLGVCLGHQAIGEAFGGRVVRARTLMHGKTSRIRPRRARGLRRAPPGLRGDALPLARRRARQPARPCSSAAARHGRRRDHGPAPPQRCRSTACSSIPSRS